MQWRTDEREKKNGKDRENMQMIWSFRETMRYLSQHLNEKISIFIFYIQSIYSQFFFI